MHFVTTNHHNGYSISDSRAREIGQGFSLSTGMEDAMDNCQTGCLRGALVTSRRRQQNWWERWTEDG